MSEDNSSTMVDSDTNIDPVNHVEPLANVTIGEKFKLARVNSGLDVAAVAQQLRMSPRQIDALEANQLEALPSPTFTRGFIRNYARLLQLDVEPLLKAYIAIQPESATAKSISLHSEGIPIVNGNRKNWLPYILTAVALGLILGVVVATMDYWMGTVNSFTSGFSAEKPSDLASVQTQSKTTVPEPRALSEQPSSEHPSDPSTAVIEPKASAEGSQMPSASSSQSPTAAPTAASPAKLEMVLKESSWLRVQDAQGKDILNKNGQAQSTEHVEGMFPLKVDIGNAGAVQLNVNSTPYDFSIHTKANVAHFVLE